MGSSAVEQQIQIAPSSSSAESSEWKKYGSILAANTKYTKYKNYWANSRFGHTALYLTSPQVCLVKTGSSPIETFIFVHIGPGLNPNEKHIHMYVPNLHLD